MSHMHVLLAIGNVVKVVHHFDLSTSTTQGSVPSLAGNNPRGFSYQTLLINAKLSKGTSVLTTGTGAAEISSTELAQVASGQVYESTFDFTLPDNFSSLTGPQQAAVIDAWLAQMDLNVQTDLANKLQYAGFTR